MIQGGHPALVVRRYVQPGSGRARRSSPATRPDQEADHQGQEHQRDGCRAPNPEHALLRGAGKRRIDARRSRHGRLVVEGRDGLDALGQGELQVCPGQADLLERIEGLVEGVFSRAFSSQVQPVEIARKLAKEMDAHKTASVSRVYVPNEYTVWLASDDYAAVLRLRMVTIIGSMMAATAAGPWILGALGPANTIVACGVAAAVAGIVGMLGGPARRLGPGFAEPEPHPAQG